MLSAQCAPIKRSATLPLYARYMYGTFGPRVASLTHSLCCRFPQQIV